MGCFDGFCKEALGIPAHVPHPKPLDVKASARPSMPHPVLCERRLVCALASRNTFPAQRGTWPHRAQTAHTLTQRVWL